MRTSDSTERILPALLAARAAMPPVHQDATNPYFSSRYASLAAIAASAVPALLEQGIMLIQGVAHTDDAGIEVLTRLAHASGEWIETATWLPLVGTPRKVQDDDGAHLVYDPITPQTAGAAITYGRRYGLGAALGIVAEEDDDANGVSGRTAPASNKASPAASAPGRTQAPPRRASPRTTNGTATADVPNCPKCGGPMWDNREGKTNPKAPDFRCKDKNCLDDQGYITATWEEKAADKSKRNPKRNPKRSPKHTIFEDFPDELRDEDDLPF